MKQLSVDELMWIKEAVQLCGNYYTKREEFMKSRKYSQLESKLTRMIYERQNFMPVE